MQLTFQTGIFESPLISCTVVFYRFDSYVQSSDNS